MAHLHALGFADPQAYTLLLGTMVQQAYLLAADDLFWLSGWLSIAMIVVVWGARRSMSAGRPAVAAD